MTGGASLDRSAAPDDRAPLALRALLLSTNLPILVGVYALGPALPAIERAFASDPGAHATVPLVGTAGTFTFAIASFGMGRVIGRFGPRLVLIVALAAFLLIGVAGAASPSLVALMIDRALLGVVAAAIVIACLGATGSLVPERARGRLLGLQSLIGSAAAIGLYPLVGLLSGHAWRWPFALHLVAVPLLALAVAMPTAAPPPPEAAKAQVRMPLRLLLAAVYMGSVLFIITVFGSLYLAGLGERNAAVLALPATTAAIGSMIGAAGYAALQGKGGERHTIPLAFAIIAAGLLLAGSTGSVAPFVAGVLVTSIGTGVFAPALNAAALRPTPADPARAAGLVNGVLYGSMILLPMATAVVPAATAHAGATLCVAGVLALAFAALWPRG